MKISIIIVNYNSTKYVKRLLDSIKLYLRQYIHEIIVVDNNSPEGNIKDLGKVFPELKLILLERNYGFGYANNRGIEVAKGDYYLLLNPDTYLVDDSLKLLFEEFEKNPNWGIGGPRVYYSNGNIQQTALRFPNIRYEVYTIFNMLSRIIRVTKFLRVKIFGDIPYEADFLFGSCLLIRKDIHLKINGFDEDFFLFAEEADYCFRAKKNLGTKIIFFPYSKIFHESGAITRKVPIKRFYEIYNSRLIFINKNYSHTYGFVLRMIIIVLFFKKLVVEKHFYKPSFAKNSKYYFRLIKNYYKNIPELNVTE